MLEIFGPHTERVLALLAGLSDLSPSDLGTIADAWRETNERDRAEAWVCIHRTLADDDRLPILAAAAVARQEALEVAGRHGWSHWSFWAAVSDAAAGVAAGERIGPHCLPLVVPLSAVMPWLPTGEAEITARRRVIRGEGASDALQKGA
jgi:hypothetical protein